MKILFLINHSNALYKFRKELVECCVKEGNEVFVCYPDAEHDSDFSLMGCRVINTPFDRHSKNPFSDFKLFKLYKRIFSKIKPDIVLTYTVKPNIYGALASAHKKNHVFATITGMTNALKIKSSPLRAPLLFLYRLSFKYDDCVFFQNSSDQSFFLSKRMIKKENAILVHGSGVNLNEKKYIDFPKAEERTFSFVGRIMKQKGIDLFVKCAESLKRKYGNSIRFLVAGFCEEPFYLDLLKRNQDNGVLEYLGELKDVSPLYARSTFIVQPSFSEGMSNSLLEAQASGRPVIASDIPGCKETVVEGENGFLFRKGDLSSLISVVDYAYSLSIEAVFSMGVKARRFISEEYNREDVTNAYMKKIRGDK